MDEYKEMLKEFVAYKSVSTDPQYKQDCEDTAEYLVQLFGDHGFEAQTVNGYGNPVVISSYVADPSYKTCLVYGHYDVQPADKSDGWDSEPFEMTETGDKLVARGIMDNKGQVLVHIATVFQLIKENKLKYNMKFFIEGNEETGSPNLDLFLEDHKDDLAADLVIISDGELTAGHPGIDASFRGHMGLNLTIRSSTKEMHTGIYGGAVAVAPHEMAKFIAGLYDENRRITIPGFYNEVIPPSQEAKKRIANTPFDIEEFKENSGTKELLTQEGVDFYTQTGLLPAIVVTTLKSGYMGEGSKNSVPPEAMAKFNFRLAPNQKAKEVEELVRKYLEDTLPEYVEYEAEFNGHFDSIILDTENEYVTKAVQILEDVYGKSVVFKYVGGLLPTSLAIEKSIGAPQVYVPFANEDGNMHGANENFKLECIENAMAFSRKFLGNL